MNSNVFIITSTINSSIGHVDLNSRFNQTLKTIHSIKQKDIFAKIVLIDNSLYLDNYMAEEIEKIVNYFYYIGHRKINHDIHRYGLKGSGDLYSTLVGIDAIDYNNLKPKRIFKICGRYILSQDFNLDEHLNMKSKFCIKTRDKDIDGNTFFHTRLWSFCESVKLNTVDLLKRSFETHLKDHVTIERAMYKNMDFTRLVELDRIHCEGFLAQTNEYIYD